MDELVLHHLAFNRAEAAGLASRAKPPAGGPPLARCGQPPAALPLRWISNTFNAGVDLSSDLHLVSKRTDSLNCGRGFPGATSRLSTSTSRATPF